MRQSIESSRVAPESGTPHSTRAEWDRIAPGYDRTNTATQIALGEVALRLARLEPGMRFLDVASGSGALSIPAARLGAHVVAVDQSPVMLELLAARAEREHLSIECRVMNGEALELREGEFDIVGSQFGVMLFADMPKGIREMARVVAPRGRILVIAYGDPRRIDFLDFFIRAIATVRPGFEGPPDDPPPLPFQLQNPGRLEAELVRAGLTDVDVATITESTTFRTGKELCEWIRWSNPIVEAVLTEEGKSSDEWLAVERAMEDLVRERAGSGGVAVLSNPVNIGIGTRG